jgi:hypothetical protein
MFQNRVLRGIFGSKKDEITVEYRKLPHDFYFSPVII